tara:strand:- start:1070 stop:1702 length:633 start_codon:yes stop_codon:yes gene_type:complete
MKVLIDGYKRFYKKSFEKKQEFYGNLSKEGQSPKFLVISCCDSRVHPAQIMDTNPGDIFVIRNVANLVPVNEPDGKSHGTSAAMEFAVKHLNVKYIIVLGHSQCGGIKTLMEGEHFSSEYSFVDPWMGIAKNARLSVLEKHKGKSFEEQCTYCEKASIEISLNNLMTFPWIKEKCDSGELNIHGWYFNIKTGALLGHRGEEFIPVGELTL